jgi:acetoin utilization deacetylase AcuC-like enzyme
VRPQAYPPPVLLVAFDPLFAEHLAGTGHPERPSRLRAALDGLALAGLDGADLDAATLDPRDASDAELQRVHDPRHLERLSRLAAAGGGAIDPDTVVSERSWEAARRAAGTGLAAVDALRAGRGDAAFCVVRPPGHHATGGRAMGFCLLNNAAVAAAALAESGQRVMVLDWDAHHGNGTQDIFYRDPRVLYVSLHEWPLYPGTGALRDVGEGDGAGLTCNLPLPAGATGDVYLRAFDDVIAPLAAAFGPSWLLVSAGYDAHRADPLTGLALSAGDFGDLARRALALVPTGRTVLFLEGGYDLDGLRDGVAATAAAVTGEVLRPEAPTSGGPGLHVVDAACDLHGRA